MASVKTTATASPINNLRLLLSPAEDVAGLQPVLPSSSLILAFVARVVGLRTLIRVVLSLARRLCYLGVEEIGVLLNEDSMVSAF